VSHRERPFFTGVNGQQRAFSSAPPRTDKDHPVYGDGAGEPRPATPSPPLLQLPRPLGSQTHSNQPHTNQPHTNPTRFLAASADPLE